MENFIFCAVKDAESWAKANGEVVLVVHQYVTLKMYFLQGYVQVSCF